MRTRSCALSFEVPAPSFERIVCHSSEGNRSGLRLDPDPVVDCRRDPLGAAEVTFSGLHGNVPEKKLNLLQLTSSGPA